MKQLSLTCVSHLILLAVLAAPSLAVFYTKGKDADYPRIGRRSWYTSGSGNHYPRIGRRASGGVVDPRRLQQLLLAGSAQEGASPASSSSEGSRAGGFSELAKRGVHTHGPMGIPGIGRRSGGPADAAASPGLDLLASQRHQLLERLAQLKDRVPSLGGEEEDEEEEEELSSSSSYPLEIMFMAFDDNGDGSLSKDEFTAGMRKYRQQNPLC